MQVRWGYILGCIVKSKSGSTCVCFLAQSASWHFYCPALSEARNTRLHTIHGMSSFHPSCLNSNLIDMDGKSTHRHLNGLPLPVAVSLWCMASGLPLFALSLVPPHIHSPWVSLTVKCQPVHQIQIVIVLLLSKVWLWTTALFFPFPFLCSCCVLFCFAGLVCSSFWPSDW